MYIEVLKSSFISTPHVVGKAYVNKNSARQWFQRLQPENTSKTMHGCSTCTSDGIVHSIIVLKQDLQFSRKAPQSAKAVAPGVIPAPIMAIGIGTPFSGNPTPPHTHQAAGTHTQGLGFLSCISYSFLNQTRL